MSTAKYINSLNELPQDLSEILITGGEPMLFPDKTLEIIKTLKTKYIHVPVYLYIALYDKKVKDIIEIIDGVQYSIHSECTEKDIELLNEFQNLLLRNKYTNKSFRLFIDIKVSRFISINPSIWNSIRISKWFSEKELLDKQPNGLPLDESLFILKN